MAGLPLDELMLKKIVLCDLSQEVVAALATAFKGESAVTVRHGDILKARYRAIVSPGNSFGDMGGGLDKAIDDYSGGRAQKLVVAAIRDRFLGEMPVGSAFVLPLNLRRVPYLVVAPTMRVPGSVAGTLNAYLAFRAALLAVRAHGASGEKPIIDSLAVSGLCTGVGGLSASDAAVQMLAAFRSVARGQWREVRHPAMAPFALS